MPYGVNKYIDTALLHGYVAAGVAFDVAVDGTAIQLNFANEAGGLATGANTVTTTLDLASELAVTATTAAADQGKITVGEGGAGWYEVEGWARGTQLVDVATLTLSLYKNGAAAVWPGTDLAGAVGAHPISDTWLTTAASATWKCRFRAIIRLSDADYLQLYINSSEADNNPSVIEAGLYVRRIG